MEIDESEIFWTSKNHGEQCDVETALAVLLAEDEVFCNHREYTDGGETAGKTTVVFVICNDLFAWACADAMDLPYNEIGNVYRASKTKWGISKWCCKQRNQKPQPPIIRDMKKDGVWDDEMEALPDNWEDAETQRAFAAVAAQRAKQ